MGPSSNREGGFSRAWAVLLLLPICALAGWVLGSMPVPDRPPAPAPGLEVAAPSGAHASRSSEERPSAEPAPEPSAEEISAWTTFDAAMAESERNGKPVLIDFNAEWCGPCQRMKREVFDDWSHGRAVQTAVIPVSIVDRAREEGRNSEETQALQARFQINAFPTLVMVSARNDRTLQTRGYGGAAATMAWITQAAQSMR